VTVKRSFSPVIDPHVRVLILGSLPGEQSLAAQRYYANPRNQFWSLVGDVIGVELIPLSYEERLRALLKSGIGLWDTVGTATRSGSLDGAIRDHVINDLPALVHRLPALRAVAFNGGKSAALGMPQLSNYGDLALVPLPSSSPAYTLPLTTKQERWRTLKGYLT
jgi:hypoxanthine-DNA glycosylase